MSQMFFKLWIHADTLLLRFQSGWSDHLGSSRASNRWPDWLILNMALGLLDRVHVGKLLGIFPSMRVYFL